MRITKLIALVVLLQAAALGADDYAGSERCLECHNNLPEGPSVHDTAFSGDGADWLPKGDSALLCEACHGPSEAHARRPRNPPAVSFSEADVSIGNAECTGCHARAMDRLDDHAKAFHATAERNELSCNRCHGGVAHGLPAHIVELRQQQAMEESP